MLGKLSTCKWNCVVTWPHFLTVEHHSTLLWRREYLWLVFPVHLRSISFLFGSLVGLVSNTGLGWTAILGHLVMLHSRFFFFLLHHLVSSVVHPFVSSSLLMKEHIKSAKSCSSNFVVCVSVRAQVWGVWKKKGGITEKCCDIFCCARMKKKMLLSHLSPQPWLG